MKHLVSILLLLCVTAGMVIAQDAPADKKDADTNGSAESQGGDAPDKPVPFKLPRRKVRWPDGRWVNAKNLIYLCDLSEAAGSEFVADDGSRLTRIKAMRAMLRSNLKSQSSAVDFNFVTYGTDGTYSEGQVIASASNKETAINWLATTSTGGKPDIVKLLQKYVEGGADTIIVVAASMPTRHADCPEDVDFAAWLQEKINQWRGEDQVLITVTGFGLSKDGSDFFRTLAEAFGGTLTNNGTPIEAEAEDETPDSNDESKPGNSPSSPSENGDPQPLPGESPPDAPKEEE